MSQDEAPPPASEGASVVESRTNSQSPPTSETSSASPAVAHSKLKGPQSVAPDQQTAEQAPQQGKPKNESGSSVGSDKSISSATTASATNTVPAPLPDTSASPPLAADQNHTPQQVAPVAIRPPKPPGTASGGTQPTTQAGGGAAGTARSGGAHIVEESPNRRFQRFDEIIGQGGFKTVYKAYDSLEGCEVAWNTVRLVGIPEDEKRRIVKEVKLLYTLKHDNILEFRGTWVNSQTEIVFITEVLSAGSLKNFINKVRVIRWKVVKRWCIEILKGLAYLHTQDPPVIHRDLKCDNIFVNGQKGDLRIGDLGLSRRKVVADREERMMTMAGTPAFMAPEFYTELYDEQVDIYAFGMCTLEMITKDYPYTECANTAQIMKLVMAGKLPQSLMRVTHPSARDFITQCLQTDPVKRPTALQLLKHSFLDEESIDEEEVSVGPAVLPMGACGPTQGVPALPLAENGGPQPDVAAPRPALDAAPETLRDNSANTSTSTTSAPDSSTAEEGQKVSAVPSQVATPTIAHVSPAPPGGEQQPGALANPHREHHEPRGAPAPLSRTDLDPHRIEQDSNGVDAQHPQHQHQQHAQHQQHPQHLQHLQHQHLYRERAGTTDSTVTRQNSGQSDHSDGVHSPTDLPPHLPEPERPPGSQGAPTYDMGMQPGSGPPPSQVTPAAEAWFVATRGMEMPTGMAYVDGHLPHNCDVHLVTTDARHDARASDGAYAPVDMQAQDVMRSRAVYAAADPAHIPEYTPGPYEQPSNYTQFELPRKGATHQPHGYGLDNRAQSFTTGKIDGQYDPSAAFGRTNVVVELDIPIQGESHIVSFEFDFETDDPAQISEDLCDCYSTPEQRAPVECILRDIKARCSAQASNTRGPIEPVHTAVEETSTSKEAPLSSKEDRQSQESVDEDDPDLEAEKLRKTKYEQNRLARMEENKKQKEKMEDQRRKVHEKELSELQKKIEKEKRSLEEKKKQIEVEWKANRSKGKSANTSTGSLNAGSTTGSGSSSASTSPSTSTTLSRSTTAGTAKSSTVGNAAVSTTGSNPAQAHTPQTSTTSSGALVATNGHASAQWTSGSTGNGRSNGHSGPSLSPVGKASRKDVDPVRQKVAKAASMPKGLSNAPPLPTSSPIPQLVSFPSTRDSAFDDVPKQGGSKPQQSSQPGKVTSWMGTESAQPQFLE